MAAGGPGSGRKPNPLSQASEKDPKLAAILKKPWKKQTEEERLYAANHDPRQRSLFNVGLRPKMPKKPNPSFKHGLGKHGSFKTSPSLSPPVHWQKLEAGGPGSGRHKTVYQVKEDSKGRQVHWVKMISKVDGSKMGYLNMIDKGGPFLTVNESYLEKQHRGKGYGKELYQSALKMATKVGKKGIQSSPLNLVTPDAVHVWQSLGAKPGDRYKIQADAGGEPDVGNYSHAHMEPGVFIYQPPSLRNKRPVPTDDPMEKDDKYLDVTKRKAKDTQRQRDELLKHDAPAGNPPLIPARTTLIAPHMGINQPLLASRVKIKQRPARMFGSKVSGSYLHRKKIRAV